MDAVQIIRLALGVISERLIKIMGLMMSCGLAAYTMWDGGWTRVATLAIFVIFTYLMVQNKESEDGKDKRTES